MGKKKNKNPIPSFPSQIFDVYLDGIDKKITMRPFTTGQESVLLQAAASDDNEVFYKAIIQVIKECVVTKKINVKKLPKHDIDLIFLEMRKHSTSEIVKFTHIPCTHCNADGEGEGFAEASINLNNDIELDKCDSNNKINIVDDVYIIMNYPTFETSIKNEKMLDDIDFDDDNIEESIKTYTELMKKIVISHMEMIVFGDDVYYVKDLEDDQIEERYDTLTLKQKQKLIDFFKTAPTIRFKKEVQCKSCKEFFNIDTYSASSFFS